MAARPRYYLDSNIIIAIVETTSSLSATQRRFIEGIDARALDALTSELTLAECLVKPEAERNAGAIAAFLAFLSNRPALPTVPISRSILIAAARFRAGTSAKLPDAIHVATAQQAGCTVFLTEDRGIKGMAGLPVERWSTLSIP